MRIKPNNKLFKDERYWELISGPWTVAEAWLMQKHIDDFKKSGIDCITEDGEDDSVYVYRCAKGYVNLHNQSYEESAPHRPEWGGFARRKQKISEFRQLQKERQRDMQRLCEK